MDERREREYHYGQHDENNRSNTSVDHEVPEIYIPQPEFLTRMPTSELRWNFLSSIRIRSEFLNNQNRKIGVILVRDRTGRTGRRLRTQKTPLCVPKRPNEAGSWSSRPGRPTPCAQTPAVAAVSCYSSTLAFCSSVSVSSSSYSSTIRRSSGTTTTYTIYPWLLLHQKQTSGANFRTFFFFFGAQFSFRKIFVFLSVLFMGISCGRPIKCERCRLKEHRWVIKQLNYVTSFLLFYFFNGREVVNKKEDKRLTRATLCCFLPWLVGLVIIIDDFLLSKGIWECLCWSLASSAWLSASYSAPGCAVKALPTPLYRPTANSIGRITGKIIDTHLDWPVHLL